MPRLLAKKIIFGCDSRGDGNSPYLTRWTLLSCRLGAIYIHKFHRSDSPEHHDHPWNFASVILWRGYIEETVSVRHNSQQWNYKRVWPGMTLRRQATWRHRVILVDDKPAWTLVFRGPERREWGFFTAKGWQRWKEYFKERGC